jgi:hypothetical protein
MYARGTWMPQQRDFVEECNGFATAPSGVLNVLSLLSIAPMILSEFQFTMFVA